MSTVAIIGADGAGKTTLAKRLDDNASMPVKYIYMGANIESSNVALPTSRLMLRFKLRSYRRRAKESGITDPSYVSTHHEEHRNIKYGPAASTVRMLNRLAETTYRHLVSAVYQLRGVTVLYDRHSLFEAATGATKSSPKADRLYYWLLSHVFPRPDLVIYLDAPPEVLLARKGEGTAESLAKSRAAYLEQGAALTNFVRVDATRPLDEVYEDVDRHIRDFREGAGTGAAWRHDTPTAKDGTDPEGRRVVDFDIHGIVGFRLVDPPARVVGALMDQMAHFRSTLSRDPDITVRFEREVAPPEMNYLGLNEAGFSETHFYAMDNRAGVVSAEIPFDTLGLQTEIVCRRQRSTIPFLLEAIQLALMEKGYIAVHASAFVYENVGVMTMGWTKGGKTSSLLAFGNHGAHYVGDEWVVISGDGKEMFGLPVPITVSDWQIEQISALLPAIDLQDRLMFKSIYLLERMHGMIARSRLGRTSLAKLVGAGVPFAKRGLRIKVWPQDLFGDRYLTSLASPDILCLMVSRDSAAIKIEPLEGATVAKRMVHSNVAEQSRLFEAYRAFRFAFPSRLNPVLDAYEERQRELLRSAFDGKNAYIVSHPYPVLFEDLFDQMRAGCLI